MAKEAVSKPLRHVARKPLSSALRGSSPFPGATLLGEFIITSPESHIGGIDFIQEDMIRKARTAIEKVLEFRELKEGDSKPEMQRMFRSGQGRRFGRQVDAALEFAMRGHIVSSLLPIMKDVEGMIRGIAKGELDHLVPDASNPEERKKYEAVKIVMSDYNWDETLTDIDVLFPKADRLWYVSTVTFAAHTYLDQYTAGLLKRVSHSERLRREMETHLAAMAERRPEKARPPVLTLADMTRLGVELRLKRIEVGLGNLVEEALGQQEAGDLRRSLIRFEEIRNKIAHRDPCPGIDEYSYDDFERDLEAIKPSLQDLALPVKGTLLRGAFKGLQRSMIDVFGYMRKTAVVALMAVLYPAVIDSVVYIRLRSAR